MLKVCRSLSVYLLSSFFVVRRIHHQIYSSYTIIGFCKRQQLELFLHMLLTLRKHLFLLCIHFFLYCVLALFCVLCVMMFRNTVKITYTNNRCNIMQLYHIVTTISLYYKLTGPRLFLTNRGVKDSCHGV